MVRRTVTMVAVLTLPQPTVAAGAAAADAVVPGTMVFAAYTVSDDVLAHPAIAAHSSPAPTIPRMWRGGIMFL
jgi:hypothetical protein